MHVAKSSQKTLLDAEVWLPQDKRDRLERSWAQGFQTEILPLLLRQEGAFARFYSAEHGAPNKPVAVVLGLLILKEMFDLTDEETVERFEFDLLWQYALDVAPSMAHVCSKTLYNFRENMMSDSATATLFASMTDAIARRWGLKTGRHRIDSTHIVSNMRVLSRLGLFVRTIEHCLRALGRIDAALVEALPKRFAERYGAERPRGYFGDVRGSLAARRLAECAEDLCSLLDRFRGHEAATATRAFQTARRVFGEQCEVAEPAEGETDARVTVKPPDAIAADSLQSLSDQDATYSGHKGKGYSVQLAETCHGDNAFQIIDHVSVTGAHESDQTAPARIHEDLLSRGHALEESIVDAGYVSGDNIVEAAADGIDLFGPMSGGVGPADPEAITLAEFTVTADRREILACPAGHAPVAHKESVSENTAIAHFDGAVCASCPLADRCPTDVRRRVRSIRFAPAAVAVAQRRRAQAGDAFWDAYAIRSGIEATNSRLKRHRGLGRLRVRGRPAVTLVATFKVLAENCHRAIRHVLRTAPTALRAAREALNPAREAIA